MKYVIITHRGYWGKADTLVEAAKNANVTAKNCESVVYRFDPDMVETCGVTDMGSVEWSWSKFAMSAGPEVRLVAQKAHRLGRFNIRLTKGQLQMTTIGE